MLNRLRKFRSRTARRFAVGGTILGIIASGIALFAGMVYTIAGLFNRWPTATRYSIITVLAVFIAYALGAAFDKVDNEQ